MDDWQTHEGFADRKGCGTADVFPVCSKPAGNSSHGVCDLAGNVWEWVQDGWNNNYVGAPGDGSAWESRTAHRVLRGGGWGFSGATLRASARAGAAPTSRRDLHGFRLAR